MKGEEKAALDLKISALYPMIINECIIKSCAIIYEIIISLLNDIPVIWTKITKIIKRLK